MHGGRGGHAGAPAVIADRGTWTVTAVDRGQVNVTPHPEEPDLGVRTTHSLRG
jgi:hypothetical protein